MEGLFDALEATAFATALRNSVWIYPLVNAGHLVGIALLIGSILPLDFRLLGGWRRLALAPLWHVLTTTASIGLVLAIVFGVLLFVARASEYMASSYFIAKMGVFSLGVVNALALRHAARGQDWTRGPATIPIRARIAAVISIAAWMTTLVLGRLIGYF